MTDPVSTQVCSSWATLEDLPEARPALSDDRWEELLLAATEILWALTGRQWSGEGCEATARLYHQQGVCLAYWPGGNPTMGVAAAMELIPRLVAGSTALKLPHDEVTEVVSVTIGATPFTGYRNQGSWLIRSDGRSWECCLTDDVTISYLWGLAPPRGGVRAAAAYAVELGRAEANDSACRLPKRVMNIQRQGISMTLIDPQRYLDKGRLGIPDIDQWIAAVNPSGIAERGWVWSPDVPRANLV